MTLLQHRNLSARLCSGLFALIFAPIALVSLGSSMVDMQASASVDQPLASVEGLTGMALVSLLLALIVLNCEESNAGMVMTFVWSIVVGVAQFFGVARLPFFMKSSVGAEDVIAGVSWCLYPVRMSLMLGVCALTVKSVRVRAGKNTRVSLTRVHRHGFGTTVALPAAVATGTLMIAAAPSDIANVTAVGLEGVTEGFEPMHWLALGAGIVFVVLVVSARRSVTGTQIMGWFTLVLPTYVVLPVWASLTGNVIVPGLSLLTKMALASPPPAVLGMVTGRVSMGILWTHVWALEKFEADDGSTAKKGPAEG